MAGTIPKSVREGGGARGIGTTASSEVTKGKGSAESPRFNCSGAIASGVGGVTLGMESDPGDRVSSPSEINLAPPDAVARRTKFLVHRVVPACALLLIGGFAFVVLYWSLVRFDAYVLIAEVVALAGLGGILLGGLYASERSPLTIDHGLVTFPYRFRRKDGTRTNRLDLREVVAVKTVLETATTMTGPTTRMTTIEQGLTLTLGDETALFLAKSRLGPRALELLEHIAQLHGVSYLEDTKKALLGPGSVRFKVLRVQRLDGDALILSKPVPSHLRKKTRRVDPGDVISVEPVQPAYAQACYLVTKTDRLRFLVLASEVDGAGLLRRPAWKTKVRGSAAS